MARDTISVSEIIEHSVEKYRGAAEAKNLSLDRKENGGFVFSDFELLTTVMDCVVDNAIKFTKAGGVEVCLKLLRIRSRSLCGTLASVYLRKVRRFCSNS